MMKRAIPFAGLIALAVALVPVTARADQASDEAAKLTEEAGEAYAKGDYGTCRAKASEAWSRFQHAQIAGLLGSCEVKLGMYAVGATHLDFYLKSSTADVNPEARTLLDEARQHVAEVTLSCNPDAVSFKIDDKPLETGSQTVFIDPGPHVISAEKEGFEPKREPQSIAAGTKITINLQLQPKKPGGGDEHPRTGKLPVWPAAVALGVGAVGVGVGIGLIVAAGGKNSDAEAQGKGLDCNPGNLSQACSDLQSTLSSKDSLGNGGIAALTVGAVILTFGAVYLPVSLMSGKAKKDEQKAALIPRVVPVVSKGFGGLVVQGRF